MTRFDVRLRRMGTVPAGQPVILLTDTIDFAAVLSGAATLSFDGKQADKFNGTIPDGTEVAVEMWNGTRWAEPTEFSRFTVTQRRFDRTDPTLQTGFTCMDWVGYRLSKALLSAQETRTFKGTPGLILDQLADEATARGWAPGLIRNFDATKDSAGVAWPASTTIDLPADQPLLQTLDVLRDAGLIDWFARGHELVVHVREKGAAKRTFTIGSHRLAQPETTSIADLATSVIVRGEDGREVRRAGNDLGLGTLERGTAAGGVSDADTLGIIADAELAGAAKQTELSITEDPQTAGNLPLVNYSVGDYVLQRRAGGVPESVRVSGVQIRKSSDTKIELDIQLMDRIADVAAKLAKRAGSLPSTAGNGRARVGGGGGGGGASVRRGIVDPSYVNYSGSPAKVSFDNGATFGNPLEFISEHPPFAGDRVAVVGDLIVGRLAAEPGEQPGSVEILEPGPAYRELDPARFGPLSIRKLSSEWVVLNGMLERDPTYTGPDEKIVAYIPGAYRPQRPGSMTLSLISDDRVGSFAFLNFETGALSVQTARPTISVSGVSWNTQTHSLWGAPATKGGVDSEGTAFLVGYDANLGGSNIIPVEYRPERIHAYGRVTSSQLARGYVHTNGSAFGQINDMTTWQLPGTSAYEWTTFTPINGYSWHPDEPFQYTKTPSGMVRLQGLTGGGGVSGQTGAILPKGFRPSFEILTPNGLRISTSGAISGMATTAGTSVTTSPTSSVTTHLSTAFIAGR